MRHFWTIFRRELGAYFNSSIAVIFVIVFTVLNNGLFMLQFFQIGKADMRMFFNFLPYSLVVFIPAISMRLWAEEKRTSTFELLLTFPMRPGELVLGKYMASLVFYIFTLLSTVMVPIMIQMLGQADPGPILGGYFGAFLAGALFLAIGIFISGLCKDQIVAFILSMIVSFTLFLVGLDSVALFFDGWISGFGTLIKNTIGMTGHVAGLSRGVLDTKDVLYFLILIGVFLFLNGLSLEGRMKPKAKVVFSTAVFVGLLCAVLASWLLQDVNLGRFDLTQDKSYTISDVSLKVLKNLKVPVQVKLYVSPVESMPTILKTLEQQVSDKLSEMRAASDGKLKFRVIHLEPLDAKDEEVRKNLQEQGVAPFQVESIQKDEVGVKLIYSTLVIEYKEKPSEIIPRIVPQTLQTLEYQLLSRIYKMTQEDKPRVAIYAPVKNEELSPELSQLLGAAGVKDQKDYEDDFKTASLLVKNNGYETKRVALTASDLIPEKTTTLVVLNPGTLNERQRYEISKFLYQGGHVVVAAQGFEFGYKREESGVEAEPKKQSLSDLNALLEKWGVKVSEDILCDKESEVISITTGQTIGPFALEMPVKFPNQIVIRESTINKTSAFTDRLPSLFYLWGSALELSNDALSQSGLKSTVLFTSSANSWKMPNDGHTNLSEKNSNPPAETKGLYPLAVLLEGKFSSAFTGKVPAWPATDGQEAAKIEDIQLGEQKPGKLIVVGCYKTFSEESIQNPGNINFYANIIDGLTMGEDLIAIRSKSGVIRDIKRVSNAEKIGYRFFAVFLLPLILLILTFIKVFLRKKEKEFYLKASQV